MPAIVSLIVGYVITRVLLVFGIGIFTFVGLDVSIEWVVNLIQTQLLSGPSPAINILGLCGAGQALNILLTSATIRVAWDVASGAANTLSFGVIGGS